MIPKVIHYIWFGKNPLPKLTLKCIESWKKHCPNYEIKKWDENSFDFSENLYAKEAYNAKKWAFVSDYARLKILYNEGGIYLDTDMEILQNIDDLLFNNLFFGFESQNSIAAGIIGAQKENAFILELLKIYKNRKFILKNSHFDTTPIVYFISNLLKKHGFKLDNSFQKTKQLSLYPSEFFYPKNNFTGKISLTLNSRTIHYYVGSWLDEKKRLDKQNRYALTAKFGKFAGIIIYRAQIIIKYAHENGVRKTLILIKNRLKNPLW